MTRCRNCPLRARMMSLFSTSSALEALTSRMRPNLSAAAGSKICERMEERASASRFLAHCQRLSRKQPRMITHFRSSSCPPPLSPPCCDCSSWRRACRIASRSASLIFVSDVQVAASRAEIAVDAISSAQNGSRRAPLRKQLARVR